MKTTLSRLPQFANIVDAAQFLHDAVDGFYSIENIGSTKISWDVKAFVEHETQSVSFGGAAIFHLLYTEAAPLKWAGVNYNSPHWEWLDGVGGLGIGYGSVRQRHGTAPCCRTAHRESLPYAGLFHVR